MRFSEFDYRRYVKIEPYSFPKLHMSYDYISERWLWSFYMIRAEIAWKSIWNAWEICISNSYLTVDKLRVIFLYLIVDKLIIFIFDYNRISGEQPLVLFKLATTLTIAFISRD